MEGLGQSLASLAKIGVRGGSSTEGQPRVRGKACMLCRHRRIRCDGLEPICRQCAISGSRDCEYPASGQATPTQILEWSIRRAERRLETLSDDTAQTKLFSSVPNSQQLNFETILSTLLQNRTVTNFFLHPRCFEKMTGSQPLGNPIYPTPSLFNAMLLWGRHLHPYDQNIEEEMQYLSAALQTMPSDLAGSHPRRVIYTIQTEILLALYYLNSGNRLKAGYHANSGASLAISVDLHQIGQPPSRRTPSTSLPPSLDAIDEEERIRAFWTVFVVTNELALDGMPTLFAPMDVNVLTPWPTDGDWPDAGDTRRTTNRGEPITRFLNDVDLPGEGQSDFALRAKASVVFSRVLSMQTPLLQAPSDMTFPTRIFEKANMTIDKLKQCFPTSPAASKHCLVVAESLVFAASIRLNAASVDLSPECQSKCFLAAFRLCRTIGAFLSSNLDHINPVLGLLWTIVADVIVNHIRASRLLGVTLDGVTESEAARHLDLIIACFQRFSDRSPLLGHYVDHIQREYVSIA